MKNNKVIINFLDFGIKDSQEKYHPMFNQILFVLMQKTQVQFVLPKQYQWVLGLDTEIGLFNEKKGVINEKIVLVRDSVEAKDIIGEIEFQLTVKPESNRNWIRVSFTRDVLEREEKSITNKVKSIFEELIKVVKPRFANADVYSDKMIVNTNSLYQKNRLKNSIQWLNYLRNDIVGQIELVKRLSGMDIITRRIEDGYMLRLHYEEMSKKDEYKKKEFENKIAPYWSIKRYKVLSERYEGNVKKILLWDGLKDITIEVIDQHSILVLAQFYDLKLKEVDGAAEIEEILLRERVDLWANILKLLN